MFFLLSGKINANHIEEYSNRLENLNTIIDVRITEEVNEQINLLVEKNRSQSEVILGRTSLYFPAIEDILRNNNMPDELKYITVIESSLLPNVVSRQGAAGIWQFMKGTANILGLNVDKYVDERRDLIKSTQKATEYLQILYNYYNDWTLALAAYNCGEGNVNKAIKRAGGVMDYWQIQKYLPRETQKYVPKFIAASYLMNYYYLHDLVPTAPSEYLLYNASVKVFSRVDLKQLSDEFGIDQSILFTLNPTYVKEIIPASKDSEHILTMPEKHIYDYIDKYNTYENLVYNPLVNFKYPQMTEVASNQTRDNTVSTLKTLANFKRKSKISTKRDNLNSDDFAAMQRYQKNVTLDDSKFYKLKRKESLNDVANHYQISLEALLDANHVHSASDIAPGSILVLP
ncbi:MAG: transglycosylase SLT domain-containing protein [Saprospiraceae bacterium]